MAADDQWPFSFVYQPSGVFKAFQSFFGNLRGYWKRDFLEYGVVEIEKADLPSGGSNGRCYRYVVANTVSTVTGYRQGTKREVSSYVSTLIEDLNIRTIPKKKI